MCIDARIPTCPEKIVSLGQWEMPPFVVLPLFADAQVDQDEVPGPVWVVHQEVVGLDVPVHVSSLVKLACGRFDVIQLVFGLWCLVRVSMRGLRCSANSV